MGKQNSVFSPEDFFSRREVAEILGVTHATITRSIHSGYLKTVIVGSRRYILRETLQIQIAMDKEASRLGVGKER